MKINIMTRAIIVIAIVLIGGFFYSKKFKYPSVFNVENITFSIKTDVQQDFSGAILVNLDEDPDLEVFIAGHGSKNLFLKNKNENLVPIEIPELSDPKGLTFSVTACDLDGDGRDEILSINHPDKVGTESNSRIFKYVNKKWKDLIFPADPLTEKLNHAYSSTCIDRKGTGQYGLGVVSEVGKIAFLEMSNSKIIDVASVIGIGFNSQGRSILGVPGPKGYTNIFVGNEGPNFYFVNDGSGHFTEKAEALGLADPFNNARGASLIDVNNDEISDLVYGNEKGPTKLFEQEHDGSFKEITPEIMLQAYAVSSAVVGDFNLDGYEDIYLNNIRGHNKLFSYYEKQWYELDIDQLAEKELQGISTIAADIDKNGSYEILNTHGDNTQAPITYYEIKPRGQWIKVSVKYSNGAIPRGTTVILRTSLREQVRVVSSGSGRFANYENDVIFGLLKNESISSAELIMPSGERIEYEGTLEPFKTNEITIPLGKK